MDRKKGEFGFCAFFHELENGDDGNIMRLFQRTVKDGEYYTAHGKNAFYLADNFFNTREVIKFVGTEPNQLPGVTLRPQKAANVVKHALLEKQWQVELYARNEGGEWEVVKKASPGNTSAFEDWLNQESAGTGASGATGTAVMAIKICQEGGEFVFGVAVCDTAHRLLEVGQFIDNDRFANIESMIVQRGARECLVATEKSQMSAADLRKIKELFDRCGTNPLEGKINDFRTGSIEQDLARLLPSAGVGEDEHARVEQAVVADKKHGLGALAAVVKQLELLRDEGSLGRWRLRLLELAGCLRLDKAAMEALNLLPAPGDSDRNMNLFGLLNKGHTAMGARLLTQWLRQPLVTIAEIERRLSLVELFTAAGSTQLRQGLQEHLRRVPDLDRMARKFERSKASLQTVVDLYNFTKGLPAMVAHISCHTGIHRDLLHREVIVKLEQAVQDLEQFEAMVEQTVDLEAVKKHEYVVNPRFDPRLTDLADQQAVIENDMDKLVDEVAADLGLDKKQVKRNAAPNLGEHFRISRKDEKVLRKNAKYTCLETRKDGVRFTSMTMKKLAKEYAKVREDYEVIQKDIVAKAVEIVVTYTPVLDQLHHVLAELDVLVGFAHVAASAPLPYCRPVIRPMGSGVIRLTASRHPCMEVQDRVSFIPNDVELVAGVNNLQVITGPNMGGKSTYIRQIGVICLMAQVGMFVPCERAEVSVVDAILARVGAGDSQLKGVSTFMKEMLEAAAILRTATAKSLIIIDELGRGTSTYDGFGLAWAICEHIATKIKGFALFATHFHELTALASPHNASSAVPGVVNKHVTAHTDQNSITMLYRVNDGPCDRSFGIHVSELANFPRQVIEMAREKAAELENFGNHAALASEDDPELEEPKRRKLEKDELDAVTGFLQEFRSVAVDMNSLEKLDRLLGSSPALQQLLSSDS